jgi:hypothetical protein
MKQAVLRIDALPVAPLDAAEAFHCEWLSRIRSMLNDCDSMVVVLSPAGQDHADWRRAAARDVAREAAPRRVNLIGGDDDAAIAAALAYLDAAPGVTGQYLPLDGQGAGAAVS